MNDYEEFERLTNIRFQLYDMICEECFRIVFYGRSYTPEYVDELSPTDRKQILEFINKYIEQENKAKMEAMNKK